jgi:hypothetical protein
MGRAPFWRKAHMKGKKELAILFFVMAALLFYISNRKDEKTHYQLPEVIKISPDEISEVVIRKNETETRVIRREDAWFVGARQYTADPEKVNSILKTISGMNLTALASETGNYAVYDLDEKSRIQVDVYQGEVLTRRITVGKPVSSLRHTFVLLDDDRRVFHAEGNLRTDFNRTAADLRDRNILTIHEEIAEVTLKNETDEMKIMRVPVNYPSDGEEVADGSVAEWFTDDNRKVKKEEIEEIINTVSVFQCDDFIEDRGNEDFPSPLFVVSLRGEKTYSISLFQKEENQYPAISSESQYPCLISEWKADRVMKDLASLVE